MNELIKVTNSKTITSREVAEWIGKEHCHVLRDIEDELSKLINGGMEEYGKSNFGLSSYKLATNNKPYPQDLFDKKNLTLAGTAKRKDFNKAELKLIADLGYLHYLEINEKYN